MSFCPGCIRPDIELQKIKEEAKAYATQNKITVAIYQAGQAEYAYIDAQFAQENGYSIIGIISHLT